MPPPLSKSVFDETLLENAGKLGRYALARPNRVFMPAIKSMRTDVKGVIKGTKDLSNGPWSFSPHYQEPEPFKSLELQKQQGKKFTVSPKPLRKRVTSKTMVEEEEQNEWVDQNAPEVRLTKEELESLEAMFSKFDLENNGWADAPEVPTIIGTFLGHRSKFGLTRS